MTDSLLTAGFVVLVVLVAVEVATRLAALWLLRLALRDALVLQGALAKTVERVIEAMREGKR